MSIPNRTAAQPWRNIRSHQRKVPIPEGCSLTPEEVLAEELKHLEKWAKGNKFDSQLDSIKFWLLKTPAIIISASSGVLAHYHLDSISVVLSGVAGAIILLDGILQPGSLRDVHYLAFFELRSLQDEVVAEWSKSSFLEGDIFARPSKERRVVATTLIERIQQEKKRIGKYLKDKEITSILTSN